MEQVVRPARPGERLASALTTANLSGDGCLRRLQTRLCILLSCDSEDQEHEIRGYS